MGVLRTWYYASNDPHRMKEVETFNPPSEITNKLFGLDEPVDTSNYGHNGEIQLSYPRFATKMDEAWLETLRRLHIASNVNVGSFRSILLFSYSPISQQMVTTSVRMSHR